MRFTIFLPLVFAVSLFWTGAANASAQDEFQKGVTAFQKGDTKTATAAFRASLAIEPDQAVVLYNLGLAEQRAGRNGMAIALWRKALAISPGFYPADQAIGWTQKKLERAAIPHDVEFFELVRDAVLSAISMEKFEALSAILFFISAWLILGYAGRRRRARLDEKPLPGFPFAAAIATTLFVTISLLALAKAIDIQDLRATVIVKKVEARALPETGATVLFDLYEGLEVIVRSSRPDWVQVTYPGGATGWVSRASVFTTADRVTAP